MIERNTMEQHVFESVRASIYLYAKEITFSVESIVFDKIKEDLNDYKVKIGSDEDGVFHIRYLGVLVHFKEFNNENRPE